MGRFVNPDNSAFQAALNSRIYVDKTGLIACMNNILDSTDAYICNSRQPYPDSEVLWARDTRGRDG